MVRTALSAHSLRQMHTSRLLIRFLVTLCAKDQDEIRASFGRRWTPCAAVRPQFFSQSGTEVLETFKRRNSMHGWAPYEGNLALYIATFLREEVDMSNIVPMDDGDF